MEEEDEEIAILLDRFSDFINNGATEFFDMDDMLSLIDYFAATEDIENLEEAINLGLELYSYDKGFKILIARTLVEYEDYEWALEFLETELYVKGKHDREVEFLVIECLLQLRKTEEVNMFIEEIEKECPYREDLAEHIAMLFNDTNENLPRTLKLIKKFCKIYPGNQMLKIELCYNLEMQGRIKEALDLCEKFLDEEPYSADIWFVKGRLLATFFEYDKALEALDFALSCVKPTYVNTKYFILRFKARCYHINGNYYKAIEVYEELLKSDHDHAPENEMPLIECCMHAEEYEKAYKLLRKMLRRIDPDDFMTILGKFVYCCLETDRMDEAVEIIYDAIKLLPSLIYEFASRLNLVQGMSDLERNGEENKKDRIEMALHYINKTVNQN
ncbi:MAG: hypothetical protein LBE91_19500 [Tannerella sp.]|jgi:pentatricopeptide repeat protein|nr:hypothetical protein [Tannerella sp.]